MAPVRESQVIQVTPKSQGAPHPLSGFTPAKASAKAKAKATDKATVASAYSAPKYTPQGDKARCQLLVKGATQCQNPLNFNFRGHGTCHTHLNRLLAYTPAKLASVRWTDKVMAYTKSLWGGPEPTPKAKATPKSGPVTKVAPKATPKAKVAPVAPPVAPVA